MSLRCFVAMAVGRPDINRVYDRLILRTLRAAGVHAVFMGRLEHNDDIDKRIIREIEQCDFAIADLTYARPSVYWEAGYAQRKVAVIYTARKDHLVPQADDKFGNFRVHFDLLMRNIIPWSGPTDRQFELKLARRLRIVLAPIIRAREAELRSRADELAFQTLPLSSRIEQVAETFRRAAQRRGYAPLVVRDDMNPWSGRHRSGSVLNICGILVQPSFTLREIKDYYSHMINMLRSRFEAVNEDDRYKDGRYRWSIQWGRYKFPRRSEIKDVKSIRARIILCSLQRIPRGRVTAALAFLTPSQDGNVFSWNLNLSEQIPMAVSIHIVDPIMSVPDAAAKSLTVMKP